jgi:hypothetical protein
MKRTSPRSKQFWAALAAVLLAAAVLSVASIGPGRSVPNGSVDGAPAPHATPVPGAPSPSATASPTPEAGRPIAGLPAQPPGISAEQWQQLVNEMSVRPDGAAELSRLAEYFRFSDAVQAFRRARAQPGSPAELQALAQAIDAGLDTRLQRREVSGGEARVLKTAVLEVLQPDLATRQAMLEHWQSRPMPLSPADAAARERDAEFMRQQAAITAAWAAQPAADRDPRVLEARLAALKQATYSATLTPERKSP